LSDLRSAIDQNCRLSIVDCLIDLAGQFATRSFSPAVHDGQDFNAFAPDSVDDPVVFAEQLANVLVVGLGNYPSKARKFS
jgi:hypothetical protein